MDISVMLISSHLDYRVTTDRRGKCKFRSYGQKIVHTCTPFHLIYYKWKYIFRFAIRFPNPRHKLFCYKVRLVAKMSIEIFEMEDSYLQFVWL